MREGFEEKSIMRSWSENQSQTCQNMPIFSLTTLEQPLDLPKVARNLPMITSPSRWIVRASQNCFELAVSSAGCSMLLSSSSVRRPK